MGSGWCQNGTGEFPCKLPPSACASRAIFHLHTRAWDCPGRQCKKWGSMGWWQQTPPAKRMENWDKHRTAKGCLLVLHCVSPSITNLTTIKRDCDHGMNPSLGPTRHFLSNKTCYFFVCKHLKSTCFEYFFWRKAKKTQSFPKMKHKKVLFLQLLNVLNFLIYVFAYIFLMFQKTSVQLKHMHSYISVYSVWLWEVYF